MHDYMVPPDDVSGVDLATVAWKTEHDVATTLIDLGHDVQVLGVQHDLGVIAQAVATFKPHIAFNMMEAFHEVSSYEMNLVAYLELLRLPYTGCNPRGMMLSRDKGLSKQLLASHGFPVPEFTIFKRGVTAKRPDDLPFPLIVKSLTEDASIGISQASVVRSDDGLKARVEFVHGSIGSDAIAERFVAGRELYVGLLGNRRVHALPVWEMNFDGMGHGLHRIATERVKWNATYQRRHGISTRAATDLPPALAAALRRTATDVYRALKMSGYARMDFRLNEAGEFFVLEANANPQLAYGEDFAESAEHAGISYEELIQRILREGLRWNPEGGR